MKQAQNLTQGNVYKTLILFAIPYLIANLIQSLYGAVDMAVVGWFTNAAGIAAVSTGSQLMQTLNSLISGLTLGGAILIGQFHGAGRREDTVQTISTLLTLSGVVGAVFIAGMLAATGPLLALLQTPPEALEEAKAYVRVCSLGLLFTFGYNAISAIMRALGDSKSPLIFIAVACGCNVALDLLFVGALSMGAGGAALATILSQAVSMALAVWFLSRRDFLFRFRPRNFHVYKDKALRLLKIGLPVSLQETMVMVSFLFIAAIVNSLGVTASAAVGVAGKFESFAMLPAGAFSGALSALVAQNIGAGQHERARKSLTASILMAFLCAVPFFVWAQLWPETVMQIFKADAAVTLGGAQYLRAFSYDFMLVAFVFCLNGFFNGCGRTGFTMVNGVVSSIVVRLPLAYLFTLWFPSNLGGVGASVPVASLVSLVASLLYMRAGKWRRGAL